MWTTDITVRRSVAAGCWVARMPRHLVSRVSCRLYDHVIVVDDLLGQVGIAVLQRPDRLFGGFLNEATHFAQIALQGFQKPVEVGTLAFWRLLVSGWSPPRDIIQTCR